MQEDKNKNILKYLKSANGAEIEKNRWLRYFEELLKRVWLAND